MSAYKLSQRSTVRPHFAITTTPLPESSIHIGKYKQVLIQWARELSGWCGGLHGYCQKLYGTKLKG